MGYGNVVGAAAESYGACTKTSCDLTISWLIRSRGKDWIMYLFGFLRWFTNSSAYHWNKSFQFVFNVTVYYEETKQK